MKPQTLFNTNLSVRGISFRGDVPSLNLPKITIKTDDHRGGGMDAPVEMDLGLEKMEAGFTTTGVRREALGLVGLVDGNAFNGVFRGSFLEQGGVSTAVVATVNGRLKEVDPGDWKPGEKAEFKYSVAVNYYKLEVGGRVVYEIDPINMVRVIDGVDQLAKIRADLGL